MTHYLICFPHSAMQVPEHELPAVPEAAHAVVEQARQAGVLAFVGGLDGDVPPVRVARDGTVGDAPYPENAQLSGGFTVLDVPTREDALAWAARIAEACRCPQEVRAFGTGSTL